MTENTEEIAKLRSEIDAVDTDIIALLAKRASLARAVGVAKKSTAVYRPERERAIIERAIESSLKLGSPLKAEAIAGIYREIMGACRALERPLRVGFLGPEGTFCEMAAISAFGHSVEFRPLANIDEVFRCAETGEIDYGVVPIENSAQGTVTRTLDLLEKTPLCIVGEVNVPVVHNLMTRAKSLADVKKISAHPQALAQCHNWLASHLPTVELVPASSNAKAALAAASDPTLAAIAAARASELYNLTILANAIQDDARNRTRFFVLSKTAVRNIPTALAKTSIWFACANVSGGLCEVLEPLKKHGVSMVKLESRPARNGQWDYTFYVDLEGYAEEEHVKAALDEMRRSTSVFKLLGSYPKAV